MFVYVSNKKIELSDIQVKGHARFRSKLKNKMCSRPKLLWHVIQLSWTEHLSKAKDMLSTFWLVCWRKLADITFIVKYFIYFLHSNATLFFNKSWNKSVLAARICGIIITLRVYEVYWIIKGNKFHSICKYDKVRILRWACNECRDHHFMHTIVSFIFDFINTLLFWFIIHFHQNSVIFIHNSFSLSLSICFVLLFIILSLNTSFYINDVNAFKVFPNKMFYLSQTLLKMYSEKNSKRSV